MMKDVDTTRVIGRKPSFARWSNIVLGSWLFASAWIFAMSEAARANTMIVGLCIASIALIAIFMPAVRWFNTLLGTWLIIASTVVFPNASAIAIANNLIVACIVVVLSLPRDYAQHDAVDRPYVRRWARHRAR